MTKKDEISIAVINTKLEYITKKVDSIHEQVIKINSRVASLERGRAYVYGVAAAISAGIGIFFKG